MSAMTIDTTTMASDQPKPEISPWLTGAKTNCPTEPPAVTMPSHSVLTWSGATRPTRASGRVKPIPDAPMPTRSPALTVIISGVPEIEIM